MFTVFVKHKPPSIFGHSDWGLLFSIDGTKQCCISFAQYLEITLMSFSFWSHSGGELIKSTQTFHN